MKQNENIIIKNIYYMLSYAFTTLNQKEYEELESEEFDNIHSLFAAILSKGISKQLKHGLYREYLENNEQLYVMRGKIDVNGTIKNRLAHKRILACDFDELSENCLFNQILKSAVQLLIHHSAVDIKYKLRLKNEMLFFSEVGFLNLADVKWSTIRFQRNNQTYRMLISLCQLITEGMLLTTESGEQKLTSFIDDQRMSRLYEKFILEYYKQQHPKLKVSASNIPWALDDGITTMLPVMQSDIILQYGRTALIIDAKYYGQTLQVYHDKPKVHSNNLYQIFAYVKNMDIDFGEKPHEVSGMLLYAKTKENIQPDCSYQMSGNKISVKTLDLNQRFPKLVEQLDIIVESHFKMI